MKVYHITSTENAPSIAAEGFRDGTGTYLTSRAHTGVWVSDRPLVIESNVDVDDCACFEIEAPEDALARREWIEEGKRYREFLVPAAVLNRLPRRQLTYEELLALPW